MDTTEVVISPRLIELADEAVVSIQRVRVHLQRRADDAVRDVIVVHPCHGRASLHFQRRWREGEVVDDHLCVSRHRHATTNHDHDAGAKYTTQQQAPGDAARLQNLIHAASLSRRAVYRRWRAAPSPTPG